MNDPSFEQLKRLERENTRLQKRKETLTTQMIDCWERRALIMKQMEENNRQIKEVEGWFKKANE